MNKTQKAAILFVLAIASLAMTLTAAGGDLFMKQKSHTDAYTVMGQNVPASDEIQSIWLSENKVRNDSEKKSFIVRLDKSVQYILDHEKKTYMEVPLNFGEQIAKELEGEDAEQAAAAQQMMAAMMKITVTIEPTSERKTIGKWACKKYLQTIQTAMGAMKSEVWATEDIRIDYDMFSKYMSAMTGGMPGMQSGMQDIQKEMKKMKGVPVLTVSNNTVMGAAIKSTVELLEFKEGQAPAGIFELPKGYKKTSMQQ